MYKQLEENTIYKGTNFKETILSDLVDKSNASYKSCCTHKFITQKELKYVSCDFKRTTNIDKLYLLTKIHKWLHNVPGGPVILNCGTSTEKATDVLDFLEHLMQSSWSIIRDSGDYID